MAWTASSCGLCKTSSASGFSLNIPAFVGAGSLVVFSGAVVNNVIVCQDEQGHLQCGCGGSTTKAAMKLPSCTKTTLEVVKNHARRRRTHHVVDDVSFDFQEQ